ncbi:MAG TPA: POTRA domain-containing protein, partial [Polyangiaceae bacterium]
MSPGGRARVWASLVRRALSFALFVIATPTFAQTAAPPATPPSPPVDTWGSEDETPPVEPAPGRAPAPPAPCPCAVSENASNSEPVRYTLERIDIRGNTRTNKSVVLRYLPFKPGEVIDTANPAFQLARYRLLG